MRFPASILCLTSSLVLAPISFGEKISGSLLFADEAKITANPISFDFEKQTLAVSSPTIEGNVELKAKKLLEMTLNGERPPMEADHYALATTEIHHRDLHRDTIRGKLIHLDDDQITLETWYAGRLTLRHSMVRSLDIYSEAPNFYNGPNGPEGWVSSRGEVEDHWTFGNRSMTSKSQYGIAREIELPQRTKISFTASWDEDPHFQISFLSPDGADAHPDEGYTLSLDNSGSVRLRRSGTEDNDRRNLLISTNVRSLRLVTKAEISIYLDRAKEGENAIYINKTKVGSWTEVDDTTLKGKYLQFEPNNSQPIRIANISISQWDGVLPAAANPITGQVAPQPEQTDPEEEIAEQGQKINLTNGDIIIGEVKKIEDKVALLGTEFGDVKVPISRMSSLNLAGEKEEVLMKKGDVRAWFHEGGYITFQLTELSPTTVKGNSQVFGEAEFDLRAFSRIEFNIWNDNYEMARLGSLDDL